MRIQNHRRKGGRRVTPMNQLLDRGMEYLVWGEEMLPELVWIGLAIKESGGAYWEITEELKELTAWVEKKVGRERRVCIILASEWGRLDEEEREEIRIEAKRGRWKRLSDGARIIRRRYGEKYVGVLGDIREENAREEDIREADWCAIAEVICEGRDKESRMGIYLHGTMLIWELATERIKFMEGANVDPGAWEEALQGRKTERAQRGAGDIRALMMASFKMYSKEQDWPREFWKVNRNETTCFLGEKAMEEPWDEEAWKKFGELQSGVGGMILAAGQYVDDLLQSGTRHEESDYRTVAEALVGRGLSLFMGLGISPVSWTGTTAPLSLRAMIEALIDLQYIAKDPEKRSRAYIEHGQGQEKLVAHNAEKKLKEGMDAGLRRMMEQRVEVADEIIRQRKADWATDVVVGDWAKSNIRKRAEEAGLEELYTWGYQPWSNASHNAWSHLLRSNSIQCRNPLHRTHGIGTAYMFWTEWNPDYMFRACKYLEMMTDVFDKEFECGTGGRRIRKAFVDAVEQYWGEWLLPEEKLYM